MLFRTLLVICMICVGTLSFAQPQSEVIIHDTVPTVHRVLYKTKDILLLFKSCYETIYFLGNTKYKGTRKPLIEEKVSEQCFCICDKIRKKYSPETFLNRQSSELQKIIAPLSNECIQDLGPFWENVKDK